MTEVLACSKIKLNALVSIKRGDNSYIFYANVLCVSFSFCLVPSLMPLCNTLSGGWWDHNKAPSTSATTPLHCMLNAVLCPPTHWFLLILLHVHSVSLRETSDKEKKQRSTTWQRNNPPSRLLWFSRRRLHANFFYLKMSHWIIMWWLSCNTFLFHS